jgi:hypothetical protein
MQADRPGGPALPDYGAGSPYRVDSPDGGVNQPAHTSGWAIASFVLGLLSMVLLSVIFGIIALKRIRRLGQKGRGLAIAGLVLSATWVVVLIAVAIAASLGGATRSVSTGKITHQGHLGAFSLATGDCFNNPAGARSVNAVTAIPCTQPHNAQVFAKFELTGSNFSFPGTAAVERLAGHGCSARTGSINKSKVNNAMTIRFLVPEEASWMSGQRSVSCMIVNPTADLTSSLLNRQTVG